MEPTLRRPRALRLPLGRHKKCVALHTDTYLRCQATSKTEPLPTSKTEPPLAPEVRLFSESFRLGLAGGWIGACPWFS